jgi:hypothetical protein
MAQKQEEGRDGQRGDWAGHSEARLLPAQTEAFEEELVWQLFAASVFIMTWRHLMLMFILGEALVGIVLLWYGQRPAQRKGGH